MPKRYCVIHTIVISILFVLLSLSHYDEYLSDIPVLCNLNIGSFLILSRHGIERFLYVVLIFCAGWLISLRGGIILLVVSAAAMLPRALVVSTNPRDALIETIFALIIGGMSILLIKTHRKSQKHEEELKEKASLFKPAVYPEGIKHVVLNGEIVVSDEKYLKIKSGKLLRKSSTDQVK